MARSRICGCNWYGRFLEALRSARDALLPGEHKDQPCGKRRRGMCDTGRVTIAATKAVVHVTAFTLVRIISERKDGRHDSEVNRAVAGSSGNREEYQESLQALFDGHCVKRHTRRNDGQKRRPKEVPRASSAMASKTSGQVAKNACSPTAPLLCSVPDQRTSQTETLDARG